MENIRMTVKMIAAYKKMSIAELAKTAGIDYDHLQKVSKGIVKMSADDLIKLSKTADIPAENIEYINN